MTTHVILKTDGTQRLDYSHAIIKKRVSENNSVSTFEALFPNNAGEHSATFSIGDELEVYSQKDVSPPTTKIFLGIIEDIKFDSRGIKETVTIKGKDYTSLLQKMIVLPAVYNNSEVSTIVTDLMVNYGPTEISTTNVNVTSTTLTHISFKNISLFDAIKQLAELSDFEFYVDTGKDLHFDAQQSISSGETLNNTNVLNAKFRDNADNIINEIYVYGARQLVGTRETFTGDGAGSTYGLVNNPHNTFITVDGEVQKGNIFEMVTGESASGTDYLVDFDKKNIIFISGTDVGYSAIPGNGSEIIIDYKKSTPIVKFANDRPSQEAYKLRSDNIIDDNIENVQFAKDIATNTIALNKDPKKEGSLIIDDIVNLTAGNTIVIDLPNQNVSSQTYTILEATYTFTQQTQLADRVLKVKVSKKINNIVDLLKQLILDIKKLQAADVSTADVLSRTETAAGSMGLRATWTLKTRTVVGSPLIWNHNDYGLWDTGSWSTPGEDFTAYSDIVSGVEV